MVLQTAGEEPSRGAVVAMGEVSRAPDGMIIVIIIITIITIIIQTNTKSTNNNHSIIVIITMMIIPIISNDQQLGRVVPESFGHASSS